VFALLFEPRAVDRGSYDSPCLSRSDLADFVAVVRLTDDDIRYSLQADKKRLPNSGPLKFQLCYTSNRRSFRIPNFMQSGAPTCKNTLVRENGNRSINQTFLSDSQVMLCAIAEIESDRRPLAYRFEPALGEASTGLMQVLQSTAEWLARDMGYRAYSVNWASEQLYRPFAAVYFGAGELRTDCSGSHV
jgi:hypothetical protein